MEHFWKRRTKHGRDKIFKTPEILREAAYDYFQSVIDNPLKSEEIVKYRDYYETAQVNKLKPFTIAGLCIYLGVNSKYFNDFEYSLAGKTDQQSLDFSEVITHIKEVIYIQKFEGSASGFFSPAIIARDLGLVDKSATNVRVQIGEFEDWSEDKLEEELERLRSGK